MPEDVHVAGTGTCWIFWSQISGRGGKEWGHKGSCGWSKQLGGAQQSPSWAPEGSTEAVPGPRCQHLLAQVLKPGTSPCPPPSSLRVCFGPSSRGSQFRTSVWKLGHAEVVLTILDVTSQRFRSVHDLARLCGSPWRWELATSEPREDLGVYSEVG